VDHDELEAVAPVERLQFFKLPFSADEHHETTPSTLKR
jgi:hypothetical protein